VRHRGSSVGGPPARRLASAALHLRAFVSAAEQDRLKQLVAIVHEKHQLDVQYSLQRASSVAGAAFRGVLFAGLLLRTSCWRSASDDR
jgi:hypothetical protein